LKAGIRILGKCRDNMNLQMQQICRGGNLISFRYRRVIKKKKEKKSSVLVIALNFLNDYTTRA
jgi:hypothetical protein